MSANLGFSLGLDALDFAKNFKLGIYHQLYNCAHDYGSVMTAVMMMTKMIISRARKTRRRSNLSPSPIHSSAPCCSDSFLAASSRGLRNGTIERVRTEPWASGIIYGTDRGTPRGSTRESDAFARKRVSVRGEGRNEDLVSVTHL